MKNLYQDGIYREDISRARLMNQDAWQSFNGKQFIITGATGQIGSFFIDALLEEAYADKISCQIFALGRSRGRFEKRFSMYMDDQRLTFVHFNVLGNTRSINTDIHDGAYFLHLASNTHPKQYATDPIGTIILNTEGLRHMLDLAVEYRAARFLFASSCEIYGENDTPFEMFSEDDLGYLNCNTLRAGYQEGKRCGEALCQAYAQAKGLDVVIPRYARVYGSTMGRNDTRAIAQFIWNAVDGKNVVIKSEGSQEYSFIYGADAVSATATILANGHRGEAYNVANLWNSGDISLRNLAEMIAIKGKVKVVREDFGSDGNAYSTVTKAKLNPAKLGRLGWMPWYGIYEGTERTLQSLKHREGGTK